MKIFRFTGILLALASLSFFAPPDDKHYYIHNKPAKMWQPGWSTGKTVVYHWRGEPDNLHPANGLSNPRRVVMDYTQRFLVSVRMDDAELRADLVKALPTVSQDGLRYTYELNDKATWDNGDSLTVEDVIFTLKANKCPLTDNAYARPYFDLIKTVETDPLNPRKFTCVMKEKSVFSLGMLCDMPVMQRKFHDTADVLAKFTLEQFDEPDFLKKKYDALERWAAEFNDAKYGRDPAYLNGLGPYKVTAWEDRVRIELVRKKDHWTSKLNYSSMYYKSYPDTIIFLLDADDNSIALRLKDQTIDVSSWISTNALVELQKDPEFNKNYHSAFVPNYNYQYVGMNLKPEATNRPPFFTDKRVRRAMALLFPVDRVNDNYLNGIAVRQASMVVPSKKNYNNELQLLPFDVEQAKQLLDEAGWKDTDNDNIRDKMIGKKRVPFEFEIAVISGNAVTGSVVNDFRDALYKAGVKANIKSFEFVTFYEQVQQHNFDMYFGAWATAALLDDYKQVWHSTSWADGSNYVGFGTPESDALIDSLRTTLHEGQRKLMDKRLQQLIYDEQPYIFLFSVPTKMVIHKRFANADMYYEKPGVWLAGLQLLPDGTPGKPVTDK